MWIQWHQFPSRSTGGEMEFALESFALESGASGLCVLAQNPGSCLINQNLLDFVYELKSNEIDRNTTTWQTWRENSVSVLPTNELAHFGENDVLHECEHRGDLIGEPELGDNHTMKYFWVVENNERIVQDLPGKAFSVWFRSVENASLTCWCWLWLSATLQPALWCPAQWTTGWRTSDVLQVTGSEWESHRLD